MYNFKTLICSSCSTVMLNLPEMEVKKINGLIVRCECCGHLNLLNESKFLKIIDRDLSLNTTYFDDFITNLT